MKIQHLLPILAIVLLSFDSSFGMNSDSSDTTSSEGTPRRVRRVIIPGSRPTMKIEGHQPFHFPPGVNPYKNVKGAERSYVPPRTTTQVAVPQPTTVTAR